MEIADHATTDASLQASKWIAADEPPPFSLVNATGRSPYLLLCDHASNRIPRRLGSLGLVADDLDRHIAWDIGAATVARRLSVALDAPLFLAGYSRLVIDCNRPLGAAGSIVTVSEDSPIPGNRDLLPEEKAARAAVFFEPYHRAIAAFLDDRAARGAATAIVGVHSFTPVFHGRARPWHVGFSYRKDRRLPDALLALMRRDPGLAVGENQPYPITLEGDFAIPVHGEVRGLPCALVEIRQDLIAGETGAAEWATRLTDALRTIAASGIFSIAKHEESGG